MIVYVCVYTEAEVEIIGVFRTYEEATKAGEERVKLAQLPNEAFFDVEEHPLT